MPADKRIPVTDETRTALDELKAPEQTYDDLLRELATQRRRQDLEQRFRDLEDADREALMPLTR